MNPYYGGPPPYGGGAGGGDGGTYGSQQHQQAPPPNAGAYYGGAGGSGGYYAASSYGYGYEHSQRGYDQPAPPPPHRAGESYYESTASSRRDRPQRHARGRSRSPDRSGRDYQRKERGGSVPRPAAPAEQQRVTSSVLVSPSDKPGEVTFSLLVPAYGIAALVPGFRDAATANSVTIQLLDESQGGSATRRCLRFTGAWDNLRKTQKHVMDMLKRENLIHEEASEANTLVLINKDRAQNLTSSLSDIQQATNTTIEVFPARGGPDASVALVVISSRRGGKFDSEQKPKAEEREEQQKPSMNGSEKEDEELRKLRREDEHKAMQRIKECLDIKLLPSELPESTTPFYKLYIPVASRFAGSVIGKHAQIVRDLQDETGAKINISREGTKAETPTEVYRFVTAEGTGAQVQKAYSRIMEFIKEAQDRAREEARDGNMFRVPLAVPDNLIGVIIGRNGKVLKDLQDDTGCKIHIEHSGKDDRTSASSRMVEISGEEEKVLNAQTIVIERLVQAMQDQASTSASQSSRARGRSRSPPPARGGGPSRPANQVRGDGDEVETMTVGVPLHQAGAIIGNRGDTVRQICEQSGARIHMEERDKLAPDATERTVTITGTSSQVAKAFDLVQKALASSAPPPSSDSRRGGSTYDRRAAPPLRSYPSQGPPPSSYGSFPPPPSTPATGYGGYGPPPSTPYSSSYSQPPLSQGYYSQPPANTSSSYYSSSAPPSQTLPSYPSSSAGYEQQQPPHMNILNLAKNIAPIGSGVITQITGSPQNPNNIAAQQSNGYRNPYM